MGEKKLKMCPDPECGKESPEDSDSCIGCGLDFGVFDTFSRILDVRERVKLADEQKRKKTPPKKQSILDSLRRRS
jgi:uncharacterized membrane protein YvbJ